MTQDTGPLPEIKQPTEVEAMNTAVIETAIKATVDLYPEFADLDPAILFAEAELAKAKAHELGSKQLSKREKALIQLLNISTAAEKAIKKGLLKSTDEAEAIADALVATGTNPSSTLKYLKVGSGSKLERALSPAELVTCLGTLEDFQYDDTPVSIATIARIADKIGVSLEEPINEYDMALIDAAMERYSAYVERHGVKDDPRDGLVRKVWHRQTEGSTVDADARDDLPNPSYRGEFSEDDEDVDNWGFDQDN